MHKSTVTSCITLLLVLFQTCLSQTEFRFANIFGDNMVLQQSPSRSQIWGYSTVANDLVTAELIVSSTDTVVETVEYTTGSNLIWLVQFSPVAALNDYEYTVSVTSKTSGSTISLSSVLFGDVYVCSGQSNMQFTVDQAFNSTEEVEDADNYPNIRVFSVSLIGSSTPQIELPSIMQEWSVASSKSIGGGNWTYFSALCWFFGKNMYNNLDYPIGLIASSYGGTPIEDWMTPDALALCNDTVDARDTQNQKMDKDVIDDKLQTFRKINGQNNVTNGNIDGKKHFKNGKNGKNGKNAKKIDNSQKYSDVTIQMQKTMYGGGVGDRFDYSTINGLKNVQGLNHSDLWNAMIFPLLFETIKGVIWYQGESDASFPEASEYTCTFASMINSWRYEWSLYSDTSDLFPFGFIQLSTWDDTTLNVTCGNNYDCTTVAAVRFGQTGNYGYVPNPKLSDNIYFATAIDLGDAGSPFTDIHPRYKQQVGKRLSNAAMNVVYGDTGGFPYIQGPVAEYGVSYSGNNTIQIVFRNVAEKGLEIKNSLGFEVYTSANSAGWMDAPLTGSVRVVGDGGYNVELSLDSSSLAVADVEYVRYNWYTAPCQPTIGIYLCAVYDMQYALPATPFFVAVVQG